MNERLFLSAPHMGGTERHLVQAVFDSNWIAPTGPMVDEFERQLSQLSGISHVAALASGSAGLHLALRLSGVSQGDEVWSASMTFVGGVAPILYAGGVPVFLDSAEDTLLIDLDLLEAELERASAIGRLPKAIITTDLYGHVVDSVRVAELRDRYGFTWISDAAESVGSTFNGVHAGKGADFAVYSFNGNKIITTSGGGALASENSDRVTEARFLSTQAREPAPHYEHKTFGYNYRLSNVCAAIGVGQLQVLEDRVQRRRDIHQMYRDRLGRVPGIRFTPEPDGMRANRWLTTIIINPAEAGFDREEARLALEAVNIESRPLWKPMHMQPAFAGSRRVGGEVAERAFADGLCLPSGSAMADADVERTAEVLLSLARR
jgi:dTDP-4-amino-4,6-dideoxygalactose transaminase